MLPPRFVTEVRCTIHSHVPLKAANISLMVKDSINRKFAEAAVESPLKDAMCVEAAFTESKEIGK